MCTLFLGPFWEFLWEICRWGFWVGDYDVESSHFNIHTTNKNIKSMVYLLQYKKMFLHNSRSNFYCTENFHRPKTLTQLMFIYTYVYFSINKNVDWIIQFLVANIIIYCQWSGKLYYSFVVWDFIILFIKIKKRRKEQVRCRTNK